MNSATPGTLADAFADQPQHALKADHPDATDLFAESAGA